MGFGPMLPRTHAAILPLDQRDTGCAEKPPHHATALRGGKDTEEEIMIINATDAAKGNGAGTLSLLLALEEARELQRRAQEEAAIEAEDILMQAEEANALDPVG